MDSFHTTITLNSHSFDNYCKPISLPSFIIVDVTTIGAINRVEEFQRSFLAELGALLPPTWCCTVSTIECINKVVKITNLLRLIEILGPTWPLYTNHHSQWMKLTIKVDKKMGQSLLKFFLPTYSSHCRIIRIRKRAKFQKHFSN